MIKSLTGFGNAEIITDSNQLNILIRSVNSRFLDTKIRGIDIDPVLEGLIRKAVQQTIKRGSVNIQIRNKNGEKNENVINFNRERFEAIENLLDTIQKEYGTHLDIDKLISINDLIAHSDSIDIPNEVILNGVADALKQLDEMRTTEGNSINIDLNDRLENIKNLLSELENISAKYVNTLKDNYKTKLISLIEDIKIDENRLVQEVAIMVDRADFTEEIVRSKSHCEQFDNLLKSNEPVGKKMNFILQELSREINTIGSKSPSGQVSQNVVELKSEIEKIREQVQNIL